MPDISLWKLCQEFSILHASLVIAGYDPGDFEQMTYADIAREAKGFTAVRTALSNAVEGKSIETICEYYQPPDFMGPAGLDIERTLISVDELDRFTRAAGLACAIFDRGSAPCADFRSPFHSRKLHAANRAWAAVTRDPSFLRGRSPKQALQAWLADHAAELELLNKEGAPNQTAIEEISKVANWKPEGGATPTPSAELPRRPSDQSFERVGVGPRETFTADLDEVTSPFRSDDECPF